MTHGRRTIRPDDGRPLSLRDAFIRRTRLDGASLVGADLTRADMTGVSARGADFRDANLSDTVLHGADLTDAKNLTVAQVSEARIDETTRLPDYIDRAEIARMQSEKRDNLV